MSGRLSARESAMNVLHFLRHLLISTFGVGVAAAVLTYVVVLPLHLFFRPWVRERYTAESRRKGSQGRKIPELR